MTILEIEPTAARTAARDAATAVELVTGMRAQASAAARLAALESEHVPLLALADELDDEVTSIGRLLALTADRAEVADASFGSMLDGWIASSADALRRSINDGDGASVGALLAAGSVSSIRRELLAALTPAVAHAWFASLPASSQLELVAVDEAMFTGTPATAAVADWKAGLGQSELQQLFSLRAMHRAGIDPQLWDPSLGLAHNANTIEAAYEYYADMYRNDPERFWWSGMAALIGPSFYGGFQDLSTFSSLLDGAADVAGGPLGFILPGSIASKQLAALGSREMADELEWYQRQLLFMQQEIFLDMATAHEAYLDGGIDTIERLYAIDRYDYRAETIGAWRQIDEGWRTGDQELIATGNQTLLRREQELVIADDYIRMHERPVTGAAVTFLMTAVGAPSVPGARTYAEVFPATLEMSQYVGTPRHVPEPPGLGWLPDVPLPHVGAEGTIFVETPLPDGNIANFDDRWALIEADTLPVYVDLAANHPDAILRVLETPIGERAEDYTFVNRLDDLIDDAVTNWGVGLDLDLVIGW